MILSESFNELTKQQRLVQKILWFAFTMSIIFLFAMSYMLSASMTGQAVMGSDFPKGIFALAAVGLAAASVLIKRHFSSDSYITQKLTEEVNLETLATIPKTRQIDAERLAKLEKLEPFEQSAFAFISAGTKSQIISLALNESIMVLGLVLSILEQNATTAVPYAVAAIGLNILTYPKPEKALERIAAKRRTM
ncbi:hypothetical protein OAO01_00375 [Oligoflexia bacterium]|nr:hypothetical protein [Oligoflexia bacterium]